MTNQRAPPIMNNYPLPPIPIPSRPTTPYACTSLLLWPRAQWKIEELKPSSVGTTKIIGEINNNKGKASETNSTNSTRRRRRRQEEFECNTYIETYMLPEAELNADKAPATLVTLLATPPPPLVVLPPLAVLLVLGSSFRVIVNRII